VIQARKKAGLARGNHVVEKFFVIQLRVCAAKLLPFTFNLSYPAFRLHGEVRFGEDCTVF
jgi:hypothetical protein